MKEFANEKGMKSLPETRILGKKKVCNKDRNSG